MKSWDSFIRSNFMIRLRSWEYWPFGIVQFPVILYYLWLSLRARSFFFFTSSNPGIVMGGMFGESKYDVIKKIPERYIPKTILIKAPTSGEEVLQQMRQNNFSFPLVFKPELGERGFMVKRIYSEKDADQYLSLMKFNFLIQELVDLPLEFGIFYTRFPWEEKGFVTSIVGKEMLSVTGDGKSTLQTLILKQDRARLQWKKLRVSFASRLLEILPAGEKTELVSIGNHAQGTKFLDAGHLITPELSAVFDEISKQIDGFYFGRFDLRCASLEDLYEGKVKILELNGCGAEPAHIYDPEFSLWTGVKTLLQHWRNIFLIAAANKKKGFAYISFQEAKKHYRQFKTVTQP